MTKSFPAVLLCQCYIAHCRNTIGIPTIINHSKEEYRAGNQNCDIAQDDNGVVYFANKDGLLSYDGSFWRLYTLPDHVIARSVAIGPDHRIYVGCQEEFVYFASDRNGNVSVASSWAFTILPPWYRTWWAYAVNAFALSKNDKEIVQLNEMLQGQISEKNKELAANAMGFVQKGELLFRIKEELMRMKHNAELEKDSKDLKKIIRLIDGELDSPHDREQFAVHFDSVHTNYLRDLKERFPYLTASE